MGCHLYLNLFNYCVMMDLIMMGLIIMIGLIIMMDLIMMGFIGLIHNDRLHE